MPPRRKSVSPSSQRSGGTRCVVSSTHGESSARRCASRFDGDIRREVELRLAMRPDLGAALRELLQSVDVVGVIVRDDHPPDRRLRHLADRRDHRAAERRRAQRVEHDDAIAGDDESGVRHEALVRRARRSGGALEKPDVLGYPLRREDDFVGRASPDRHGQCDDGEQRPRMLRAACPGAWASIGFTTVGRQVGDSRPAL